MTDKKVYDALTERHSLLHQNYRVIQFLLFSVSGFSDWLISESKKGTVQCISLEQLYAGEQTVSPDVHLQQRNEP